MTIDALETFLISVDNTFPESLSNKTNLSNYANKLLDNANLFSFEINSSIVGLVAGYIDNSFDDIAYISLVSVKSEYQGQGIAKALMKSFIAYAKTANIYYIHLYADRRNIKAQRLYESLGFEIKIFNNESRPGDLHYVYYLR